MKSGQIKARTKWKDVYPAFANDARYLDMLGNPGSNPLELFWDAVDDLDQQLDAKIALAESAIKRYNKRLEEEHTSADGDVQMADAQDGKESGVKPFKVAPETTLEEFIAIVRRDNDDVVGKLTEEELDDIYRTVSLALRALSTGRFTSLCIVTRPSSQAASGRKTTRRETAASFAGGPAVCAQEAPGASGHQPFIRRGK